jgi:hypothetical protein
MANTFQNSPTGDDGFLGVPLDDLALLDEAADLVEAAGFVVALALAFRCALGLVFAFGMHPPGFWSVNLMPACRQTPDKS